MIKAMVLLHVYESDRFVGQSLVTVEAENWIAFMRGVTDAYPSGAVQCPFVNEAARIPLPILRDGYSTYTSVRVMQIIPIPDDAVQHAQRHTELDVELASVPRREQDALCVKAEPITSYDDLVRRASGALDSFISSHDPSPQERADAFRTVALLRDFALIHLQGMNRNQANEAVRISAGR